MRRRGTPVGARRPAAAGAALVLGGAGVLLGLAAVPAQAAQVSFATHCVPPAGIDPVDGTTKVEITAPATAKVGDTVDIVWKFAQAASKNPDIIDLPANSVQPSGVLKAAGAQTADIAMQGPRENPAIPKGGSMVLSDMKGSLKLTTAGEVTLTPDAYTVNAMSTDTKCSPKETVQKAATIQVTGGGTSTATPTGSSTPTGSATPTKTATATPTATGGTGQTDFTGKEVQIPYACKTPIGDKNATSPVQINARKNGGSYDLTVQFKKSVMDSPADIPKDSVKPSMEVVLGGADKGTVHVEGPANANPIKSGDPIEIPDLTGTYKPGADGTSTLSPGVLTVKALGTTTTCTPKKTEVSLTLDTAQQPGGAAGGTSTSGGGVAGGGSGDSGDSGSGGLAETGSSDHGGLKALGLVAGTAILLGAAVFTFMPRRRTR
ncbi:hypothetical protein SAMN05428944_4662 [Streptomyces sp. 1222.5]|uniref:hypothetical protein n=1 Tax=unclassified Streptomyces TaxID=2593676 RepID=UPI000899D3E1|nr:MULTISPECIES: hypothetical protein [unclassified Streptomyces]PKW08238.1 hypothetical protein BX260_3434 [Streptomyces sp. 5112.2]SEC68360.1 hypothetical protein SAMN05428944_4662 [Streptomyces sp. 1222.5]